jgi:hypothetical protein
LSRGNRPGPRLSAYSNLVSERMTRLAKVLIILLCAGAMAEPAIVQADKICVVNQVRVKKTIQLKRAVIRAPFDCPAKSTEILDTRDFAAAVEPKAEELIGFAKLTSSGTILSMGGSGTTAVKMTPVMAGVYDIVFSGSFPALGVTDNTANREAVTVLATVQGLGFEVIGASVSQATSSEIKVRVATWRSNVLTPIDANVGIALLVGRIP